VSAVGSALVGVDFFSFGFWLSALLTVDVDVDVDVDGLSSLVVDVDEVSKLE